MTKAIFGRLSVFGVAEVMLSGDGSFPLVLEVPLGSRDYGSCMEFGATLVLSECDSAKKIQSRTKKLP